MITRLEIIKRQTPYPLRDNDEGLIVPGRVPKSANRLMRTFREDRVRATKYPVDYYRETFLVRP